MKNKFKLPTGVDYNKFAQTTIRTGIGKQTKVSTSNTFTIDKETYSTTITVKRT